MYEQMDRYLFPHMHDLYTVSKEEVVRLQEVLNKMILSKKCCYNICPINDRVMDIQSQKVTML